MKLEQVIHEFYDDLQEFLTQGPFQKMEEQYIPYLTYFEKLSKDTFTKMYYLEIENIDKLLIEHNAEEKIYEFIHQDAIEEAERLYAVHEIILNCIKSAKEHE